MTNEEKELKAFNLAMLFRKEFIKYDYKCFSYKNVKKSKWWQFFLNSIEKYSLEENWNPELFVKAQFEIEGKVYPHFLVSKKAQENYKEWYEYSLIKPTEREELIKKVLNGVYAVKTYCEKNKNDFSISFFLSDESNKEKISKGILPIHLFLFSKTFNEIFKIKETSTKALIRSDKELLEKIKKLLKEDYE